jgi:secondary thiamine-phosphate synthase enzyme
MRYTTHTIRTTQYIQFVPITDRVLKAAEESGIQNGMVTIISKHTTTGIMVNEALECIESDIIDFLSRQIPEDYPYIHAHMLRSYGSTAGNPTGHIKGMLMGNHCHFPLVNGEIIRGGAQDIFFCEFDGPAERTFLIIIQDG